MKTTPLRQKFTETLTLKGYSPRTIQSYVSVVAQMAKHYRRSPDRVTDEEVRAYLHHLHTETNYSSNTVNVTINGLRSFYREVLERSIGRVEFALPRFRKRIRRPQAYSLDEIQQLFENGFTSRNHRTFFMTIYGAGLRISEACHLKVADIDSKRMLLRIRQGKGHKDRYTLLPQSLLHELRVYYREYRPQEWLFPSPRDLRKPWDPRSAQIVFKKGLERAELPRKGGPHSLRHSFATHLIESGTPLHVVKRLMGHTSVMTTAGYLHISKQTIEQIKSPLDSMTWHDQWAS